MAQMQFQANSIDKTQPLNSEGLISLQTSRQKIVGPSLQDVNLARARLVDTNLTKANLQGANAEDLDARLAKFVGASLRGANLSRANLKGANLNGCDLSQTDLTGAILDGCTAQGARFQSAQLIGTSCKGADFTNARFESAHLERANLSGSLLQYTSLSGSTLLDCILQDAALLNCRIESTTFDGADLSRAFLREVRFWGCTLERCAFVGATLISPRLDSCALTDVGLIDSSVSGGSFCGTKLTEVDFEGCKLESTAFLDTEVIRSRLSRTSFSNINLVPFFRGPPRVGSPSHVDYQSIVNTLGLVSNSGSTPAMRDQLLEFLSIIGIPRSHLAPLVNAIYLIAPEEVRNLMQSTFISYGAPDENFASRLNTDLQLAGVKTFFFPADAQFGEKLHQVMRRVNDYDRTILVCSRQSLERPGLQYELEKTLEKEASHGGTSLLIPIAIDDFVFSEWAPARSGLRDEILNRVVADFRKRSDYRMQFARLIDALSRR